MTGSKRPTRESILQQWREAEPAAAQLITGVAERAGNWQLDGGRGWSIWPCLEHLSLRNQGYRKARWKGLSNAKSSERMATGGELKPGWFARWFVAKLEPPVGIAVKTKRKATPLAKGKLGQAVACFAASHAGIREIVKLWDSLDLHRVRYPNPFIPLVRFTVGTGLLIAAAHDRRHPWQAQRVKQAPGYLKA